MALTTEQAEQAADIIHNAFEARTTIDELPGECAPAAADAVMVQEKLLAKVSLPAAGYKAGFTNPPMLEKSQVRTVRWRA